MRIFMYARNRVCVLTYLQACVLVCVRVSFRVGSAAVLKYTPTVLNAAGFPF